MNANPTTATLCKRCNVQLKPSKGLVNDAVFMGEPDFPGNTIDSRGQTFSADLTRATLVDVLKCRQCGYSVRAGQKLEQNSKGKGYSMNL